MFSFFIFLCRSETTFTYDDATKTLTINADSYYDYNKIDEICPGRPFTKAIYTGTYQELVSSTFRNSRLLTTVEIGENVKSINMYVFTNCVSLREFIIPPNVESIGQYCFKGCTGLTSIKWHRSNMEFNIFCFAGLTSLETFTQAEGDNTTEVPGKKHIYYEKCFRDCSKLRTVILPPNVGNLDLYTFYGCKSLTGFVFPPELKKYRCHCFENCESLTEMDLSNVEWLGNYVSELFFQTSFVTSWAIHLMDVSNSQN